jgi:hypothetical protein
MTYADAWQLDSGMRDNIIFTIDSAYFAPSADYMGGKQILLFLIGRDENDEPFEHRMSVGGDWTTADGGRTIMHPTRTKIVKTSVYGHWITAAQGIPDLLAVLYERGHPTQADIWENLIIRLRLEEISFGKNIEAREKLNPAEFMGITQITQPPLSLPAQPDTITSAIEAAKARRQQATAPAPTGLLQQMVELAKVSTTFEQFRDAALNNDDVLADSELAIQVADQTGVWAIAHP